jgi:hypothetical protein
MAVARPEGPPPTINTSVFIVSVLPIFTSQLLYLVKLNTSHTATGVLFLKHYTGTVDNEIFQAL